MSDSWFGGTVKWLSRSAQSSALGRQLVKTWLVITLASLLYGGWQTYQVYQAARTNQALPTIQVHLDKAVGATRLASALTAGLIPDVELWREGVETAQAGGQTAALGQTYISQAASLDRPVGQPAAQLISQFQVFGRRLAAMSQRASRCQQRTCMSAIKLTHPQLAAQLADWSSTAAGFQAAAEYWLTGQRQLTILLQNSEELRATGGFIGSFAQANLTDGRLSGWQFYDIYDADGQFHGFVPAPPGAREYLSAGRGLRLPDANWHPDFALSAQTIQQLLSQSGFGQSDLLAAVNLDLIEQALTITGPVFVQDFGITVTAQNLSTVARADRTTFFAGSQAKKNFLQALFTQLKLKLNQLDPRQQAELLTLLLEAVRVKDLQFYAADPNSEQLLISLQAAGQLGPDHYRQIIDMHSTSNPNSPSPQTSRLTSPLTEQQLFLYPVESNVGINKANQNISRLVQLDVQPGVITLSLEISNLNQQPTLRYLNYQRLITLPATQVRRIEVDGQSVTNWTRQQISNAQQQDFGQLGFLVDIPAGQTKTITIQLTHLGPELPDQVIIGKQPGLPPTSYQVKYNEQSRDFVLTQDSLITN